MSEMRSVLVDLAPFLDPERVIILHAPTSKEQALRRLAEMTAADPAITQPKSFMQAIFEREEVSSTGVGGGIAVPHAKLPFNLDFVISIGVCPEGIDFSAKDGQPVSILIMIAAPESERNTYLRVLATVAAKLNNPSVTEQMRQAQNSRSIIESLLQR